MLDLPPVPSSSRPNIRRPPPPSVNDVNYQGTPWQHPSLTLCQQRPLNQPNWQRAPSPATRRYAPPDRYVPPRSIVFTRDDYPNVYRPNNYRPDHSRRDSRSSSPGDRYGTPRNSDPIKASPMKASARRPRPSSPPRDMDRNRTRLRRPDLMLASRMSDHPPTHPLPDRPRDSWVDASRSAPERPFRKFGGDSYRPAERSSYDSYRPSYEDSRHYTPREPLSPVNGASRSRYDRRRSRSGSRSQPPSPRTRRYRQTSIGSSRSRSRSRSKSRSRSWSRSRSQTCRNRSSSRGHHGRRQTGSRSLSQGRSGSRRRSRSPSHSHTRSCSRGRRGNISRSLSRSLSRSSIASSRISVEDQPKASSPHPPPTLKDGDAVKVKAPVLVQEMIQQVIPFVAPTSVVETPSPGQMTVRLPAFDHPLYEERPFRVQEPRFAVVVQPQPIPERVESSATVPVIQEIEMPQLVVAQEPSRVVVPVDVRLETQSGIPITVPEPPVEIQQKLATETLMPQTVGEAILSSISPLTPNETPAIGTPVAPSEESLELVEAIVKNFRDDAVVTPEQEVVVEEKGVVFETVPFHAVLSPSVTIESPEETEIAEEKVEVHVPAISGARLSAPPSPAASEKSPVLPVEESEHVELNTAEPAGPSKGEVIENQITTQDIPPLADAKSSSEALRIVVMRRLLCDRQTREERVNPVLLGNQSIVQPVETFKSVEELISEVCNDKRHQDRMSSFVSVKRILEKQFTECNVTRLAKVQRLRKEYLALHEKWEKHCAALDEQSRTLASETETIQPAGRTTRRSAATLGDAVRSDLEMEQIIASLGNDEATDPAHLSIRNLATIPDMISVTHGKVDYVYDDTNHHVENPIEYYGPHTGVHDWTEEEKKIFLDKFAEYPKQFGAIANFLPNKTQAQCVAFYYLHKKKMIDFRKIVSQFAPNKRRRRGTGKKKGIIADIQQHDAEVSVGRGGGIDLLTVPSRVSKGKKVTAQAEGGRKANNSRRAILQQERTPVSTPTPEPEASTSVTTTTTTMTMTTMTTTARNNNRRRRGQTQTSQNGTKDGEEDAADVDPRPTKRAKRSRKTIKSASTVVEDSPTILHPNLFFFEPVCSSTDTAMTDIGGTKGQNQDRGPGATATVATRRRSNISSIGQWSEADKSLFLSLLAQHGDDFKRIAASMPNKTTVQVGQFYKNNLVDLDLERITSSVRKRHTPPPGFPGRRSSSLDDDKNAEAPAPALAENQRPMYAIPSEGWLKHGNPWRPPDDPELLRCSPVTWKNAIPPQRELLATTASDDGEYASIRLNDTLDKISSKWQNLRDSPTSDLRSHSLSAQIQPGNSAVALIDEVEAEKHHVIEEVKKRRSSFGSGKPPTMAMVVDRQPSPPPPPPPLPSSVISARRRLLSVAALTGADEPVYPVLNPPASTTSTAIPPSLFYS